MTNGDCVVVAAGRTVVVSTLGGAVKSLLNIVGGDVDGGGVGSVVEAVLDVEDSGGDAVEAKDGDGLGCSGRLDCAALS
jgi:hypothetical protein